MRVLTGALALWLASSPGQMSLPLGGLKPADLRDNFEENRSGHVHEAIDILAPRGTPVRAVVSGTIRKLFLSKPGGNTIYLFDDEEEYSYYYAHLDRYAKGLREGMRVQRGETIAYVGSTGNAGVPHLHFAIFELGPKREWWKGDPVNPYPYLVKALKEKPRSHLK
jgi:peptidoglycan LD-endopeptidase LytH